jgi:hypothetical protein
MTKINELTPEQDAQLEVYEKRWIEYGLSTDPIDRTRVEDAVGRAYQQAGLDRPRFEYRSSPRKQDLDAMFWGSFEAGTISYYAYFREVVGLVEEIEELTPFIELCQLCGPIAMYDDLAIIHERPEYILFDDEDRLHSETGPAVRYSDGFSVYSWHGVSIPGEWTDTPPSPAEALAVRDLEQRRAACEMVGWDTILEELSAVVIDEDSDPLIGTLVEVNIPDIGKERFLRVVCGTGRRFALPVPPTMGTALSANAWTYDIDEDILRSLEVRT